MPPELTWAPLTSSSRRRRPLHEAVGDHASHLSRSGIIAKLRAQSRELALSCFGGDQMRSFAFDVAADDIAWGRAPLIQWRAFVFDAIAISDAARGQLGAPPLAAFGTVAVTACDQRIS